jgi:SAM-dependent methyltransferase
MTSVYDAIPDFGLLYDAVPAYGARTDAAFYAEEAAAAKGPILELGCGTGRVLLPIARAGGTITGIDSSSEMIVQLCAKVADEPDDVRARVTVKQASARHYDLKQQFGLIIAPFRVFQHMLTVDDQLAMLETVAHHLAPGGRFIFDVFNPKWTLMATDRSAETEDTPEFELPDGRRMRRTARIRGVRWLDQVNDVELIYYVTPKGGSVPERYVQSFGMRWYMKAELEHLLSRAGLWCETVYGNFDRSPLRDDSPEQIWVASL